MIFHDEFRDTYEILIHKDYKYHLEEAPVALFRGHLHHGFRSRALTLAQRYRVQFRTHFQSVREFIQFRGRVRAHG